MVTFLVDMDSVCNDLWAPLLGEINDEFGTFYTINNIRSWDLNTTFPPEIVKWLHARVRKPGFFRGLPIRENCYDVLKEINSKYKVMIVTAHPKYFWRSDYYHGDKMGWVEDNLDFLKPHQVVFTATKNSIRGDVLIDDAPKNLEEFDRITVAFDHPYNTSTAATFRAGCWNKIKPIANAVGNMLEAGISRKEILKCSGAAGNLLKLLESKASKLQNANHLLRCFLLESRRVS